MSNENTDDTETPQKGAPKWMVTFGDLMSLLLCFFVLLLSFSKIDAQKYRELAGSMANAFGVQKQKKVFKVPMGDRIIAREYDRSFVSRREKEAFGKEVEKAVSESQLGKLKDLIQVQITDDEVIIRMMGETTFDSGKAEIRPKMLPLLRRITAALQTTKGPIVITGHTDNVPILGGRFESNLVLSSARATRVAQTLLSYGHLDPRRISISGFGEFQPIVTNETPEGREKNRRVEIVLEGKNLVKH